MKLVCITHHKTQARSSLAIGFGSKMQVDELSAPELGRLTATQDVGIAVIPDKGEPSQALNFAVAHGAAPCDETCVAYDTRMKKRADPMGKVLEFGDFYEPAPWPTH
jgi:hypothetical protein